MYLFCCIYVVLDLQFYVCLFSHIEVYVYICRYVFVCMQLYVRTCIYIYNQSPLHCINCPLLYRSKEVIHITIKGTRDKTNNERKRKTSDTYGNSQGNKIRRAKEIKIIKRKKITSDNNQRKIEHMHFGPVINIANCSSSFNNMQNR